ncbi:FecR domain-containing protein [Sinomicrobium weinanense]|uniref:DUF4974 domain-containing protein n=1 Tax=Sinomicrobium weinanense TaxID=2842200 RepID=A0A926JUQ8_9FLAO|nr:FecR domain-containing protein [Sinomicrobium weinanense]MBC9797719.1 DUF4974 domain-containing protein [Sinomicrobium weinanense]MBU3122255.1 DUF4974 domain-containing protein [Sinomicrobium weinanense]
MDKKKNIKINYNLLIKKAEGFLTEKEKEEFDHWYEASPSENRECSQEVVEGHRRKMQMLFAKKTGSQKDQSASQKIVRKLYWRVGMAASVVILLSLGIYFYDSFIPGDASDATFHPGSGTSIEIGSSKAVLTLEDGTEVSLKKGETYTSGNASSDGESLLYGKGQKGTKAYNELTVPRGGEFFVLLADSTKVWLNSDTKIKYPDAFTDGQPRIVELLYGEAFFEVSPAAMHGGSTFKVTTRNQEIEVLGTQFNVAAYREDRAVTSTLVEGKVAVRNGNVKKELSPGEQAAVTAKDSEILISKVDVYNYTVWKKGLFSFDNKPLKDMMQVLARWYDMEVKFENREVEDLRFSGLFGRDQEIDEILSQISDYANDVQFEIKGKEVIVK